MLNEFSLQTSLRKNLKNPHFVVNERDKIAYSNFFLSSSGNFVDEL